MRYWFITVTAVIIFLYSVYFCYFRSENKRDIWKVRKIWYAVSFLVYSFAINWWYMPSVTEKTRLYTGLGIIQEVWDILIYFLVVLAFAVLVDLFVIRTISVSGFKVGAVEGTFAEETKESISELGDLSDILLKKMYVKFKMAQSAEEFIKNNQDEKNNIEQYASFIEKFLQCYITYMNTPGKEEGYEEYQNLDIRIKVYSNPMDKKVQEEIRKIYRVKSKAFYELQYELENNAASICSKNMDTWFYPREILFIPYTVRIPFGDDEDENANKIMIVLEQRKHIVLEDGYDIVNILTQFESYLFTFLQGMEIEKLNKEIQVLKDLSGSSVKNQYTCEESGK